MPVHILHRKPPIQTQLDSSVLDTFADADSVRELVHRYHQFPEGSGERARAKRVLNTYWHIYDMMIADGRQFAQEARDFIGQHIGVTLQ